VTVFWRPWSTFAETEITTETAAAAATTAGY